MNYQTLSNLATLGERDHSAPAYQGYKATHQYHMA